VTLALEPPLALAVLAQEAFERHGGPLLVAAAEAPRLTLAHAQAALGDLADGADATFGPAMDGGWYLAGLAHPHAAVLALLEEAIEGEDVMGRTLGVALEAHLEVGLLRMERLLRTARDAAALRIDPLVPERVRRALVDQQ
jgi:hypothetical protein